MKIEMQPKLVVCDEERNLYLEFEIGEDVHFQTGDGKYYMGEITKITKTTLTIKDEGDRKVLIPLKYIEDFL